MPTPRRKQQAGYALILMVLGLMGIGGVVLVGFTQDVKQDLDAQRYAHNRRVLQEAKQALLMYAYNYPLNFARGPGRLPCPDTNNSGTPNPSVDCLDGLGDEQVGRFPWDAVGMEFYEARDASNEHLWYAVSKDFANFNAGTTINSDTLGSITIYDQSGGIIYDANPGIGTGVAAVIIAPGPPIALDEDNDGIYEYTQVRRVPIERDDPRNYLDTYNGYVNSVFTNDESDSIDDGFIHGPIVEDDPNSAAFNTTVVNDQMIVITTDELIEVAEKAVLQAYRTALKEYRENLQANLGVDRFPWLDPYDSADGLDSYDAVVSPAANPVVGRMPSIFADYFVDTNPVDSEHIKPELRLSIFIDGDRYNMSIPAPGTEDTFFKTGTGDLVTQIPSPTTITRYFWDGYKSGINGPPHPNSPIDNVWEMCPTIDQVAPIVADEDDCNRTTAGTFEGAATDGTSDVWLEVRLVTITFNGITDPIEFALADRTATPIEYWRASPENPELQNHVYIAAEYDDNPSYISNFNWIEDEEFLASHAEEPVGNNGNPTYDGGDTIKVGLPYYPVLADWLLQNNWHNMVQVAYTTAMRPDGDGTCNAGVDDCLTLQYPGGNTKLEPGILLISGRELDDDPITSALVDDTNPGIPPYFADELGDIFDGANDTLDLVFDFETANGTDKIVFTD